METKVYKGSGGRIGWDQLEGILADHRVWLDTDGRAGVRADLSSADLSDMDMTGVRLERAILVGVNFLGSDLSEALLDHAKMTRANLGQVDLSNASLIETDLTWANLNKARLVAANLTGACLPDVDLTDARLKNADFTNADLEGADLRGADIAGVVLNGTDLTGTLFDSTHTGDAGMDAAYEAEEVYEEPDMEPVSELPDADVHDEEITGDVGGEAWVEPSRGPGVAQGMEPEPSEPEPVDIPEHLLWRSLVSFDTGGHPDFEGVQLHGLSMHGADLRHARNLTAPQLAGVDLSGAQLPEEIVRFAAIGHLSEHLGVARRLCLGLAFACLYVVLTVAASAGMSLSGGSAALTLPFTGVSVPALWVTWGAPVLLLWGYVHLHLSLQRAWEAAVILPVILPDGNRLDRVVSPWLVFGMVGAHLPRLRDDRPRLSRLQYALGGLLAWGTAPATLALLFGACFLRAGLAVTVWQGMLMASGFGFGLFAYLLFRRTLHTV
ncbi:MAG: pentapeptide repeat-containing protein [Leptospirillia bacterium]